MVEVDSTYENMVQLGFMPKQRTTDIWDASDIKILQRAVADLKRGVEKPQVKDLYYWLSHYKFHDAKISKQVKWMVNQQIRNLNTE